MLITSTFIRRISINKITSSIITFKKMSTSAKIGGKVAVCQMTAMGDKCQNLSVITDLIERASNDGAKMLFFPEGCDYMSETKEQIVPNSEPILGGFVVEKYRELACKYDVWLSMGGVHEKNESDPSKIYNTHLIISNKGDIVQSYRKIHMFDVVIPEKKINLQESAWSMAGSDIVTPVQTPFGNVGMAICYDMRFPELSTQLALMGAHILTFPSAFTFATGKVHWEILLRCRAIENQCYVIAAAQVGQHNPKRVTYGHACIIDPWGKIIADCGDKLEPCYAIADIDLDRVSEIRRNMPVLNHRRNDVYSLYALSLRKRPIPEHSCTHQEETVDSPATMCESADNEESYVFGHVKVPQSCVFHETQLSYAFVNIRCVVPGHVLVAPKRLISRTENATPEEMQDFFSAIVLVQKLMERVHKAKSSTITIQDGPDAGQTVQHLHCHVMPRKSGDFKDNDLIYLELAKHDRVTSDSPKKPARKLEDMRQEAALLRDQIKHIL